MDRYILNDQREAVLCDDDDKWCAMFEDPEARRVARTQVGPYDNSTVFLGLDHRFNAGPPVLFETMVFAPAREEDDMGRCSTWAEAEAMHAEFDKQYSARNEEAHQPR